MIRPCLAAIGIAALFLASPRDAGAATLPAAIRDSGMLHLTVNGTYAPMEYHDPANNVLKGLDVDLANALAKRLGVEIVWSDVPFAQLMPSLETSRADFIISGLSDRAARRGVADFVDYLKTGPQFFVLAASPIKTAIDLCGRKVGAVRSTSFPAEIAEWSKQACTAAGKPMVVYVPGENSPDVRIQLKQDRIDAAVQGSETLPYVLSNDPDIYRIVGEPIAQGFQGIAFRKNDTALREAVTEALRGMIADGSYKAILAKYGLAANAVAEPMLNAAPQ